MAWCQTVCDSMKVAAAITAGQRNRVSSTTMAATFATAIAPNSALTSDVASAGSTGRFSARRHRKKCSGCVSTRPPTWSIAPWMARTCCQRESDHCGSGSAVVT